MANTEQKGHLSKARKWVGIFQLLITIAVICLVFWRGVSNGLQSDTSTELAGWIIATIIISTIFAFISFAVWNWDQITERLENQFKLLPAFRRWFIFPGVLASLFFGFGQLVYWNAEITLKIIVTLYFGVGLPAALISLIREDRLREKSPLGDKISRKDFVQNPQATVAYAFTIMEARLKEKIGAETEAYGDALINEAFAGEKSRLKLVLEGKDYTSHLRNFMSGAYGLLRNPRHHLLIEDDEHVALSVLGVAGLMSYFIDESEYRNEIERNKDADRRLDI